MTVRKMIAAMAPAMLLAGVAAHAYSFNDVNIEQWVGSGSKSAVVVVDFGPASYAFGVRWDGTMSGRQALEAIDQATTLTAEFGESWGGTNLISYNGYSNYSDTDTYDPTVWWWEYWNSTDGETWNSSWVSSGSRMLTDGAWDGWGWSPPWPAQGNPPATPTSAVPEPSSIVALLSMIGFAGSARLLGLRRK